MAFNFDDLLKSTAWPFVEAKRIYDLIGGVTPAKGIFYLKQVMARLDYLTLVLLPRLQELLWLGKRLNRFAISRQS